MIVLIKEKLINTLFYRIDFLKVLSQKLLFQFQLQFFVTFYSDLYDFTQNKMKNKQREINGYVLMDCIGKGSYAEVFKCKKKSTDEIFAMKIFKELKQCGPQKIKKQVEIVQKLNHPNIIRCYDYFVQNQDQTKLYAVFQYCEKGTLKELTEEQMYTKNRFTEIEAKTCIKKILQALIYLHKNKIAHRDLKLDNILINSQLDIKLADFGLSKSFEEGNVLDTFCGTPLTMAPQILGKQESYSEKCDTWSFGVISYFLIYLDYPFYSSRMTELKRIIEKNELHFPQDVQISKEGKDFLKKCLTVDPQKRSSVQKLKFHPWFSSVLCSKIRVNSMKQSMGESSQHVQKSKNQIKSALKTQIDKIILCTNLFPARIEQITKGFEEYYPKQKLNLFLFMLFAFNKLQQLKMKGFITLNINGHQMKIENRSILKLSKHFNHLLQLLQGRMKSLVKLIGQINQDKCARSYQILIKFFANQAVNLIEGTQQADPKKLKFFISLSNFLNTTLVESTIDMKLNQTTLAKQSLEDIILYVQNILSVEKILKAVNSDENSIDLGSQGVGCEGDDCEWVVEYRNRMKVAEEDETWSLVGEAIERALTVKQLINSST